MIKSITVMFEDGSEEVLTMPVNVPAPVSTDTATAEVPVDPATTTGTSTVPPTE